MYMKSLVSLAVLGAMSAVATAGDHVVFDKPNESYTVDGLNKYGATINASDITITNTTYNGIDAYGVFDLNAANDISIQGATNGIFTPTDHENSSITITTPKKRSSTPSESKVFIQTGSVRIQASQTSRSAPSCLTVSSNWRLCDSLCERSHFGPPSSSLRTGSGIM